MKKWMVSETLIWALGLAFLSALGCFGRLALGPDFGQGDTAMAGRVLDVAHSPLAFIGGGALVLALAELMLVRKANRTNIKPRPPLTSAQRTLVAAQCLVAVMLLNCHRLVLAMSTALN